jgi:hypothetical protein
MFQASFSHASFRLIQIEKSVGLE